MLLLILDYIMLLLIFLNQIIKRRGITKSAHTTDDGLSFVTKIRMLSKWLTGVNIGKMNFYKRFIHGE